MERTNGHWTTYGIVILTILSIFLLVFIACQIAAYDSARKKLAHYQETQKQLQLLAASSPDINNFAKSDSRQILTSVKDDLARFTNDPVAHRQMQRILDEIDTFSRKPKDSNLSHKQAQQNLKQHLGTIDNELQSIVADYQTHLAKIENTGIYGLITFLISISTKIILLFNKTRTLKRKNKPVNIAGSFPVSQINMLENEIFATNAKPRHGYFHASFPTKNHIWLSNNSRQILKLNSSNQKLTSLLRNVHPVDRQSLYNTLRNINVFTSPVHVDLRIQTQKKDYQWLRVFIHINTHDQSPMMACYGALETIHEAKSLPEQLAINSYGKKFHICEAGLMTSGFTHNLKNPLAVISMHTEVALNRLEQVIENENLTQPERLQKSLKIKHHLTEIVNGTIRINNIINDILYYHKFNAIEDMATVNVNDAISIDLNILEHDLSSKDGITLVQELHKNELLTNVRPNDLTQIFLNLVSNARDALVGCNVRRLTIRSGFNTDANQVWFSIHDTGTGIPKDILKNLGTPFISSKKQQNNNIISGGTGLGIFMVKKLLKSYHGELIVDSNPGDTLFTVLLPIAVNARQTDIVMPKLKRTKQEKVVMNTAPNAIRYKKSETTQKSTEKTSDSVETGNV